MNRDEKELEARLNMLPDVYFDFVRLAMLSIKERGLVREVLEMLDETESATTETVLAFEGVYCGDIEVYDAAGSRMPVSSKRLALTRGMRDILSDMKGKTFKSYQFAPIGRPEDRLADRSVRINLGRHAVDLNCCDFAFSIAGRALGLGAMHCERMSLLDDFRPWDDAPFHAYAVNERVTRVELVADHVEVEAGGRSQPVDIDVAVAVGTAHAVYTFARESWRSTGIRISVADGVAVPYGIDECDASWMGAPPGEMAIARAARTTTRLA